MGLSVPPGPWSIRYTVCAGKGWPENRDLGNAEKLLTDLLVAAGLIEDDSTADADVRPPKCPWIMTRTEGGPEDGSLWFGFRLANGVPARETKPPLRRVAPSDEGPASCPGTCVASDERRSRTLPVRTNAEAVAEVARSLRPRQRTEGTRSQRRFRHRAAPVAGNHSAWPKGCKWRAGGSHTRSRHGRGRSEAAG